MASHIIYVTVLVALFFSIQGVHSIATCKESNATGPIVTTPNGKIQGVSYSCINTQISNVTEFLGIPYAAPPVGSLRWQSPQEVTAWKHIRDGSVYGDSCVQVPGSDLANDTFSEDCLYLNIWTPSDLSNSSEPLPVLVWIHGGSFVAGSGSETRLKGHAMASLGNVVVVNINYRLGWLGFLANANLIQTDNQTFAGNFGLLDQTFALEWVRDNIKYFGGDASKVTLSGESAGASSVCLHMVMPNSKDLFHQAIVESSACFIELSSLTDAVQTGLQFQQNMNCDSGSPDQISDCLRNRTWEDILKLAPTGGSNATLDGIVIVEPPYESLTHGRFHKLNSVMSGNVLDEGTLFIYPFFNETIPPTAYVAAFQQLLFPFRNFTDTLSSLYPCSSPSTDCRPQLSNMYGDFILTCPTIAIGEAVSDWNTSSYLYLFAHTPTWAPPAAGAYHSSEIDFVFSTVPFRPNYTQAELELANDMTQSWVNFVNLGTPDFKQAPTWKPASNSTWDRIVFDANSTAVEIYFQNDFEQPECSFWKQFFTDTIHST